MQLAEFYSAVLPSEGHYALFELGPKRHVWATSIAELAKKTEVRIDEPGLYFATASYKDASARSQENVLALRALRLDIDAGAKKYEKNPDGCYPTQTDALKALVQFARDSNLAPSFIVSSGEGLHAYWCFGTDIDPPSWAGLARALAVRCEQLGLKADPTVTRDTARILRPPGTLHPNGSRVTVLKNTNQYWSVTAFLDVAGVPWDETETPVTARYDTTVNADVRIEGPPKSIFKVVENCPAMGEAANKRGDIPEPYWRAMLGICKHTVEGIEIAHEMSMGYAGYSEEETAKKYEAYTAGPPTCAEFSKHTKACETCPHNGKIKSPIVLGYLTDDQVALLPPEMQPAEPAPPAPQGMPWDGHLPPRFTVVGSKGHYTMQYSMQVKKEDEGAGGVISTYTLVPVTHDIFWFGHWAEAHDSKDTAQVTVHVYQDGIVKTYLMDQTLAASRFDLLKWLAGKAVHISTDKKAGQAVEDYVKLQLQRIKNLAKRPKIAERFGLRITDKGELVCAQGQHVIFPDGRVVEAMLSDALKDSANHLIVPLPPGNGEWENWVWNDYIIPRARSYAAFMKEYYGRPGLEKYQLAAMLGLASPFMAFVTGGYHSGEDLPPNGLSVSLYSRESGQGKTALVQAIMLAFGNPDALVQESNQAGATDIGRMARLSMWGTFPVSMEEMGQTKETSITNMISAVANGGGRTRGTRTGGFTTAKSWALINLVTTNRSQRDMVASVQKESSAIQNRLLELNVDDVRFERVDRERHADAWATVKESTKGALGAVVNYAACRLGVTALNRALVDSVKRADQILQADQGARFQYRAFGAVLFLQELLTKLGLQMFDEAVLIEQFKIAHDGAVEYIEQNITPQGAPMVMAMALSHYKPHTLITDDEYTPNMTDKLKGLHRRDKILNHRIPDKVLARHVQKSGITYIACEALREYCEEKKISEAELLKELAGLNIVLRTPGAAPTSRRYSVQLDLFKGTPEEEVVRCRCYKIDTRQLHAQGGEVDMRNVVLLNPASEPSLSSDTLTPTTTTSAP